MNWTKLTIFLLASVLCLSGCFLFKKSQSSKLVPQQRQWGQKGVSPTAVWTDYNWEIIRCDECGILENGKSQ